MRKENLPRHGKFRNAGVPLCAEGLRLTVEAVTAGRLGPAVVLRVYSALGPTNVGATIPASEAEELAALVLAAGRMALEVSALTEQGPGAA